MKKDILEVLQTACDDFGELRFFTSKQFIDENIAY